MLTRVISRSPTGEDAAARPNGGPNPPDRSRERAARGPLALRSATSRLRRAIITASSPAAKRGASRALGRRAPRAGCRRSAAARRCGAGRARPSRGLRGRARRSGGRLGSRWRRISVSTHRLDRRWSGARRGRPVRPRRSGAGRRSAPACPRSPRPARPAPPACGVEVVARLVDDDHRAGGSGVDACARPTRRSRIRRAVIEVAGIPASLSSPEALRAVATPIPRMPGRRPGLARGRERGRLAGARQRGDGDDPLAAGGQAADHLDLLGAEVAMAARGPRRASARSTTGRARLLAPAGDVDEALLHLPEARGREVGRSRAGRRRGGSRSAAPSEQRHRPRAPAPARRRPSGSWSASAQSRSRRSKWEWCASRSASARSRCGGRDRGAARGGRALTSMLGRSTRVLRSNSAAAAIHSARWVSGSTP